MSSINLAQQMMEMIQKQQELIEVITARQSEVKIDGLKLPSFYGRVGESVDMYVDQVARYFDAKNIKWQDPTQSSRIIAMMTANFRGNAAAWYMLAKDTFKDVQDLIQNITIEFVPPDIQERLRDQLYSLKQKRCQNLEEYIFKYRVAIMQVKDMSDLDKITYFVRGLESPIKEEVQYRRCKTVSEALSIALEYERSHRNFNSSNGNRRSFRRFDHRKDHTHPSNQRDSEPEPMEIDSAQASNQKRNKSSKFCRYCKKSGHIIDDCYKRKNQENRRNNNSNNGDSNRFRRQEERTAINYFDNDSEEGQEILEINDIAMAKVQEFAPNELIRKDGLCEGKKVKIMLDTGASCNVIRPGLSSNMT